MSIVDDENSDKDYAVQLLSLSQTRAIAQQALQREQLSSVCACKKGEISDSAGQTARHSAPNQFVSSPTW